MKIKLEWIHMLKIVTRGMYFVLLSGGEEGEAEMNDCEL
jgi:hypothetical protein